MPISEPKPSGVHAERTLMSVCQKCFKPALYLNLERVEIIRGHLQNLFAVLRGINRPV